MLMPVISGFHTSVFVMIMGLSGVMHDVWHIVNQLLFLNTKNIEAVIMFPHTELTDFWEN